MGNKGSLSENAIFYCSFWCNKPKDWRFGVKKWIENEYFLWGFVLKNNNDNNVCVITQLMLLSGYSRDASPEVSDMQRWQNILKSRSNLHYVFSKLLLHWLIMNIFHKIFLRYISGIKTTQLIGRHFRMTCVECVMVISRDASPKIDIHFYIFA